MYGVKRNNQNALIFNKKVKLTLKKNLSRIKRKDFTERKEIITDVFWI